MEAVRATLVLSGVFEKNFIMQMPQKPIATQAYMTYKSVQAALGLNELIPNQR